MSVACPHCTTPNTDGSKFCVSCGRAVPGATRTGPRVLADNDLASSSVGQSVQIVELERQIRPAVKTLFWLGMLHVVVGLVFIFLAFDKTGHPGAGSQVMVFGGVIFAVGTGFIGMSAWARKSPLPATVTGLSVYVTLTLADVAMAVSANATENIGRGLVIRGLIVAALARAVSAAVKHRALTRQMAQDSAPSMRMAA